VQTGTLLVGPLSGDTALGPVWDGSDTQKASNDNGMNWETTWNRTIYLWKLPNNTKQPQNPLSCYHRCPPPLWQYLCRLRKHKMRKELNRKGKWMQNEVWYKCIECVMQWKETEL
jgi:hypothetical protein